MAKISSIRNRKKINYIDDLQLSILALPAVVQIFIFAYLPMVGIFIAFKDVKFDIGLIKSPWVGFLNFKFFFTSQDAWMVTRNTIGYNFIFLITGTIAGILLAILLNEITKKILIKVYQTIMFFPYFFSWVIVSYMLYGFINPQYGFLKPIFLSLGIPELNVYVDTAYWPWIFILVNIWKSAGYGCILYYASIISINKEYYEAAEIDGASKLQKTYFITIPLILPLVIILVLLNIGRIFYSDFGMFYFLSNNVGMLYPVTQVIDSYVYNSLRSSSEMGMAAAVGLYQSTVGLILVLFSNYISGRITSNENKLF